MKVKNILKQMYFVKFGARTGQFLIFIDFDKDKKLYSILGVPESEVLYISENDIERAITYKVLDYVETLPTSVFDDCKREFKYRENGK